MTGLDADLPAAQRIVKGTQSMTVFKDSRIAGAMAIDVAVDMARGEMPETTQTSYNQYGDIPSILLTSVIVDKSNLESELIDSGWYTREQVYGKEEKQQ